MKKAFFILLLLIVALINVYILSLITKCYKIDETLINIEKNISSKQIAKRLYDEGIIKYPLLFYYYVRFIGYDKYLQAGTYLFKGDINLQKVAKILKNGRVFLQKVTFPEGWSYKRIAKRLARNKLVDYNRFVSLCSDSSFVKKITGYSKNSLEGFLYPDTYYFPKDVSEEFIIDTMVNNFFSHVTRIDIPSNFPLKFYQILILASIVERESGIADEKPLIAGVYIKRFLKGYKLQADPTVAYALETMGKTRKKIFYKDLKIKSPYNTYINYGLPPTPICNPSLETIKAVINYKTTDYLFFFANNGKHIFSKTYQAHINKQNSLK